MVTAAGVAATKAGLDIAEGLRGKDDLKRRFDAYKATSDSLREPRVRVAEAFASCRKAFLRRQDPNSDGVQSANDLIDAVADLDAALGLLTLEPNALLAREVAGWQGEKPDAKPMRDAAEKLRLECRFFLKRASDKNAPLTLDLPAMERDMQGLELALQKYADALLHNHIDWQHTAARKRR